MSILIPGLKMPPTRGIHIVIDCGHIWVKPFGAKDPEKLSEKAIELPPHGRLIDADALRAKMYHEAFETDTPMQKWDSGCWIRYKLFEMTEESAPTIIQAEDDRK